MDAELAGSRESAGVFSPVWSRPDRGGRGAGGDRLGLGDAETTADDRRVARLPHVPHASTRPIGSSASSRRRCSPPQRAPSGWSSCSRTAPAGARPPEREWLGRDEEVELSGVEFPYPGTEPVLRRTLLPRGARRDCGADRPSGAGKSTVARLVVRFADPQAGHVSLDGYDLRALGLESVRGNVAASSTETLLFDASVRDDIAFGRPGATTAEIEAAARAAGAHDFISASPEGYDTRVGQRGRRLSGGQRRRVEIARTLLRDAPVVVLDEPTAGLDAESAEHLVEPLRALLRGRSALLITHDARLLRCADRVLRLEPGRRDAA